MKKRIFLSALAVIALALGVVGMSAYEAHVINVTATIENALNVPIDEIDFGTVFPQEELDFPFSIALSSSFLNEDRVDDVVYIIRQKPKCGWTLDNGKNLLGIQTASGHVDENGEIICPEPGSPLRPEGSVYGPLPLLCPYLSKHILDDEPNQQQVEVPAFHKPWIIDNGEVIWTEAKGILAKSLEDVADTWNIDLKVPCFGGQCAQDWEKFVTDVNPNANPADFVQPSENEQKVFGCDLWVEVTEVSRFPIENGNTD